MDEYLSSVPLQPTRLFRRGEPCPQKQSPRNHEGFLILLSQDGQASLRFQKEKALELLRDQEQHLKRLPEFGAHNLALHFRSPTIGGKARPQVFAPELLMRAGQLGIFIFLSYDDPGEEEDTALSNQTAQEGASMLDRLEGEDCKN